MLRSGLDRTSGVLRLRTNAILFWCGLAAWTLACAEDEFPVETCVLGQGIQLSTEGRAFWGADQPSIEVAVFGDFKCSFSLKMMVEIEAYLNKLDAAHRGDVVQVIYRHFPRADFPMSRRAALALEAANLQGASFYRDFFWILFVASDISDESIANYAVLAGLEMEKFYEDWESREVQDTVAADIAKFGEIGFNGLPGVVLCGKSLEISADKLIDNLEHLVEKLE
jgi:protein-disulfide isomerase